MYKIPLMKNAFLNEDDTKEALGKFIMGAKKLSMGEMCEKFEKEFARYQGKKYAVLFNSGGSANLALLQALLTMGFLKKGDKVGFSTLTWSTNVMPIIQMGLVPVAIDVDKETMNVMSWNLLDRLEETEIQAFFGTNVLGFSGDLDKIKEICDERGIIFLEDNCEALGAEVGGLKTGDFGMASTFSFFVAHHMSTIEGGMVVTDSERLYYILKMTRANGWDRNLPENIQKILREEYNFTELRAKYGFYALAFNVRPTEITGFLGCEQIKFLEENIEKRNSNNALFEKAISENDDLLCVKHGHMNRVSPFGLTIICKDKALRDKYLNKFIENGIEVRPTIAGNIQNQPFYEAYVDGKYDTPNADFFTECGFYCGNYPDMTEEDLTTIINCLHK